MITHPETKKAFSINIGPKMLSVLSERVPYIIYRMLITPQSIIFQPGTCIINNKT